MDISENSEYQENGVTVNLTTQHDKPTKCKTFLNPKMVICREFVLACLKTYCDEDPERFVKCLDAFGATGIGGLQWKHHQQKRVEVTINDISTESFEEMKRNCAKNGMEIEKGRFPEGFSIHNTLPPKEPTDNGVELILADANVTLHLRQFHFIHIDPYGSTVNFLDAAFRNIYNKGVMIVTSTDVSSIYGKCPEVTSRSYNAYTKKTDYYKEMAARVVIAGIVRAAARCSKGLEVLYTVAVEHFVQVAVRIKRGAQHADKTLTHIRKVLHCLHCEEYAILPNTISVSEKIYDNIPCTCNKTNPGRTAVELGPMWCGSLFSPSFVERCLQSSKQLKLSTRCQTLLQGLHTESLCSLEDTPDASSKLTSNIKSQRDSGENNDESRKSDTHSIDSKVMEENGQKRKLEDNGMTVEPPQKRPKRESRVPDDQMPPFYYDIHRRKIKGYDIPKANKFVQILHEEGYRASRTTFDPMAVRTNATYGQVVDVIHQRCSATPKPSKVPL